MSKKQIAILPGAVGGMDADAIPREARMPARLATAQRMPWVLAATNAHRIVESQVAPGGQP